MKNNGEDVNVNCGDLAKAAPSPLNVFAVDESVASEDMDDLTDSYRNTDSERGTVTNRDQDDDPGVLVRRANMSVTIIRVVFILMFVLAATGCTWTIYRLMYDNEEDEFNSEYEAISQVILAGINSDLNLRFFTARTLANMVSSHLDGRRYEPQNPGEETVTTAAKPWMSTVSHQRFARASYVATTRANAQMVFYSPIIRDETARAEFESYTIKYEQKNGPFRPGVFPTCMPCLEDPSHTYGNGETLINVPGFGAASCGVVENAMRGGLLDPQACPVFQGLIPSLGCKCGAPSGDADESSRWSIDQGIFAIRGDGEVVSEEPIESQDYFEQVDDLPDEVDLQFYSPVWQSAVLSQPQMATMYNQMSEPVRARALRQMMFAGEPVMSEMYYRDGSLYTDFLGGPGKLGVSLFFPIKEIDRNGVPGQIVGSLGFDMVLATFLTNQFPSRSDRVQIVVENNCGQANTFTVNSKFNRLDLVGKGDLHETKYDDMVASSTFQEYRDLINIIGITNQVGDNATCAYRFSIYPTQAMEDYYITDDPKIFAISLGSIFLFTALAFLLYDYLIRGRQAKIMAIATRTNRIVSSLFPQNVRERMYELAQAENEVSNLMNARTTKLQMEGLISGRFEPSHLVEPIADLFPNCTVLFIDIANFTAWSSERGPEQVFMLLQNLYLHFDAVAKEMGVFKVETIGDSYMAVVGLPKAHRKHAVLMARFAHRCLRGMSKLMKELELTLGPDTGDLQARCGLHSGPVTAGVLQGEKARFQLFGDTVNTASRMESNGEPGRIHVSPVTANLISAAGKQHWILPRKERIFVKGKGEMQTFWVRPKDYKCHSTSQADSEEFGHEENEAHKEQETMDKKMRLVEWNVKVLYELLEQVVAASGTNQPTDLASLKAAEAQTCERTESRLVIDELTEIISLPGFDRKQVIQQENCTVLIKQEVREQLKEFVKQIAFMYRDVPFHNFDHVSHVIMSADKMMKRILEPEDVDYELYGIKSREDREVEIARQIHESTYGISSDRLMQFTVVFSALIHDVDHTGLTNKELVEMKAPVAVSYNDQSVAEQNSVDLAWKVLMDDKYAALRYCIYNDVQGMHRFRQLLVGAVMATDIADKKLQSLRKMRWKAAFDENAGSEAPGVMADDVEVHRKATIVYEYIIQASDVSHTMQHWNTFRKFNFKLFEERYVAWLRGAAGAADPSEGWYKGEIGFFQFYVIPLAKKLDRCGVFGVSYQEFLHHAEQNKQEWERKGEEITKEMLAYCQDKYKDGLREVYLS